MKRNGQLKKWIQEILKELNQSVEEIIVYEDNQSTLKILDNENMKSTKHMEVKFHFLKDVKRQGVKFEYCASSDMLADILTKPLGATKLKYLNQEIGLLD